MMKRSAKIEENSTVLEQPMIGVNAAIRMFGVPNGKAAYLKKKYPKGTRFTIDEWKIKVK